MVWEDSCVALLLRQGGRNRIPHYALVDLVVAFRQEEGSVLLGKILGVDEATIDCLS